MKPVKFADKLPNTRILLAEDNLVNQEAAQYMLHGLSCTVDIVGNGLEAIKAVVQNTYDLVFMDCMMPVMDGYQATAEIRRQQSIGKLPHFPIIALTASAIEGDREKCLIAGMDDYLSKPFKTESLLRVLNAWIKTISDNIVDNSELESEPTQSSSSNLDIYALETIRDLGDGGDNDFLQGIVKLYLNNTRDLLDSLELAFVQGNIDAIRAVSHTLVSSSSQIGACYLAELCREMELEARNQHYDTSGQALDRIKHEFANTHVALDNYIQSPFNILEYIHVKPS